MYCHLLIMNFFWFAYLWFRINIKAHNKAFADVDWGGVGRGGRFGCCSAYDASGRGGQIRHLGEGFSAGELGGIYILCMLKLFMCRHIVVLK